jgi:hypothetical protein
LSNAGVPHPEWISGLKTSATTLSPPGFSDYFSSEGLNQYEATLLSILPGGYSRSTYTSFPTQKNWIGFYEFHVLTLNWILRGS